MTPSATALVTDYVLRTHHDELPAAVRHEAKRSFVNILGCTLGGARHAAVETTWTALAPFAGREQATLIGRNARTDPMTAALINTLASSVNTYDDTHTEAIVHPSGPVMAAVLAVAEMRPVSGAELIAAFGLGVEVVCRLSKALSVPPARSKVAWSQTGLTCGVGAALAAARLLRLDRGAALRAVGIAASQAAGIRAMHGTMCTALMPAQAGQTGLRAAFLAEAGLTSSETTFEHRYGVLATFAEEADAAALTDDLGTRFELLGNTYKPYPCGIVIHPLIDGALSLRAEERLDWRQIRRVSFKASPAALALCDRRHPKDEFEGQVSLQHWTAAALVRGKAGVREGGDAAIADPELAAFRERVSAEATAGMPVDGVDMEVELADGRRLARTVRNCLGSKGRPMSDAALGAKLEALAEGVLAPGVARQVLDVCWRLESLPDAAALARHAA